ncbi:hypothetical protein ES319_D11G214900v1 [Gossypium barbadense]|uniref:Uncharacterized protein n=1 Tax=Gossypium barbadense TaxID=3634 RepID=A0A5J5PE46_GOSBA|nr:hypothetical protein ES319_D11G214900v1 [Gossypium barbadense]KAB2004662.1 hypothetical protein ES319_D11G214900v1 [Gossypium barbadense]
MKGWAMSSLTLKGKASDQALALANIQAAQKRPIRNQFLSLNHKEPMINTYANFRDDVLPRIKRLGYNAVQIMAIQEHSYYASFGYHVTNFFAPSSRFGTPDDLKSLI